MDTSTETGGESALGTTKRPGPPQLAKPFVSVIVTNYNYAKFIEECLASIFAQTYANFECIVVDDRSTDGSPEVVRTYLATHPEGHRARLHECTENGGQMAAFIEGFRLSKGTFVVFVDADDWLFPEFLETHLAAHLNARIPAGLSCSDEVTVDGEGRLMTGTLELRLQKQHAPVRLAPEVSVFADPILDWRHGGVLTASDEGAPRPSLAVTPTEAEPRLFYVAANANPGRHWIWTTTSAIMFRRGLLEIMLTEAVREIRICGDFYLLHFGHLIGGTLLLRRALGAYRRHGSNNFATSGLIGTGAPSGSPSLGVTYAAVWTRMRESVEERFAAFAESMGEAQAMRLLAALSTLPSLLRAHRVLGTVRRGMFFKFLVILTIQRFRRVASTLRRLLHFF